MSCGMTCGVTRGVTRGEISGLTRGMTGGSTLEERNKVQDVKVQDGVQSSPLSMTRAWHTRQSRVRIEFCAMTLAHAKAPMLREKLLLALMCLWREKDSTGFRGMPPCVTFRRVAVS